MEGPMDDAINEGAPPDDKARRRYQDFVTQRYPGGVPPGSAPADETSEDDKHAQEPPPRRKDKNKPG